MSKQELSSGEASAPPFSCRLLLIVVIYVLLLSVSSPAASQTSPATTPEQYVPPELQVADPNVKTALDAAEKSANLGNYGECLGYLQKALQLATKQKSPADRAIVENRIAVYYATQGNLQAAKSEWLNALSDGTAVTNLVLQADVLVALSALSQQGGDLDESLKGVNRALALARKSKNLYIQSRALGELSRLQLLAGRTSDARASLEEALQIDRANGYSRWEPGHILYMAWVTASESKLDKAIELASSARTLAVKNNDYITFIQASSFIGNAYVHSNRTAEGIAILERVPSGTSQEGKPLFQARMDTRGPSRCLF